MTVARWCVESEVLYETDCGRYTQVEEVFSGCGASLLLRRATLEQIGVLDDDFFMYYEDTDLCWRAWLGGWKVVYAPQALVPHIHCGTTKEWSPFFFFLTERNRLAMVFKNGSLRQVFRVWGGYLMKVLGLVFATLWALLLRRQGWRAQAGAGAHPSESVVAFAALAAPVDQKALGFSAPLNFRQEHSNIGLWSLIKRFGSIPKCGLGFITVG